MIKAKKGLLIALFAAMMVFAFGAASAFAVTYGDYGWNKDYTKVTVAGGEYDTVRTADVTGTGTEGDPYVWDGLVTATIDVSEMTPAVAFQLCKDADLPAETADEAKAVLQYYVQKDYYDLENAVVDMPATMTQADFSGYEVSSVGYWDATYEKWNSDAVELRLNVPDYVDNYDTNWKKAKVHENVKMNKELSTDWEFDLSEPEGYEEGLTTNQSFSLVTIPDAAYGYVGIKGNVPAKEITVKGVKASARLAKFYKDSVSDNNLIDCDYGYTGFLYNGSAHTIVMGEMTGYKVEWSVFNKTTGVYDTVLSPSITDVDYNTKAHKYNYLKVKAQVTSTSDATDTYTFDFNMFVLPADAPSFAFDEDGNAGAYAYAVEGSTYDPTSFVVLNPCKRAGEAVGQYTNSQRNKANKQATEANKTAFMELFNDVYEIESTATKAEPNTINLEIVEKDHDDWTDADWKAFEKKYEQLGANFGIYGETELLGHNKATVFINSSFVNPEVEFTNTPTAVTYKAKALKKKAKSFTVTATCNTGAAVSYKLIDAPAKITIDKTTGQITLKKGLKKGTYKIKVKAYVTSPYFISDYYGVRNIAETQAIKIKVKK
jgi:hypothetical protein